MYSLKVSLNKAKLIMHLDYKLLLVFGIWLTTQYIFGSSGPICNAPFIALLNSEKDSWILKCEQFLDPILYICQGQL